MAQDLREIKKKKDLPPIVRKQEDPAALYRSKDAQLAVNKRQKLARLKADEAYAKAMAETIVPEVNVDVQEIKDRLVQQKQLIQTLTATSERLAKELEDTVAGEQRPVKMQIGKNKKQIANAELKIADLEQELEDLK